MGYLAWEHGIPKSSIGSRPEVIRNILMKKRDRYLNSFKINSCYGLTDGRMDGRTNGQTNGKIQDNNFFFLQTTKSALQIQVQVGIFLF